MEKILIDSDVIIDFLRGHNERIRVIFERIEDKKIITLGKKLPTAKLLLTYLFRKPVINAQDVQEELKVSLPTANSILSDFEKLGIITERTGWKRNREFEFTEYLELFTR